MANLLFEVTVLDGSNPVTLRMSSAAATSAGVQIDGHQWPPVIVRRNARSGSWSDQGIFSEGEINDGSLSFRIGPDYGNEDWSSHNWNGALGRIFKQTGDEGDWSAYKQVFEGAVSSLDVQGPIASVGLLGPNADLDTELLSASYAGTGGSEGSLGMRGQLKPLCIGEPKSVEPVQVDKAREIYQVHAYGPVQGIQPYEFGQLLDPARFKGNQPDYATLANLTMVAGDWATCDARGMFRLGGTPSKKISADVYVDARTSVQVIRDLLLLAGIPAAKIATLTLAQNGPWSLYQTAQITIGEVARLAAYHSAGVLYADGTGTWRVMDYLATRTPVTLKADRSALPLVKSYRELNAAPPLWKVKVGYDPCFGVHSLSDISPMLWDDANAQAIIDAAAAAQAAAAQAAADAAIAKDLLDKMAADGWLTRNEKAQLIQRFGAATAERPGLLAQGTSYNLPVQRNDYSAAYDALKSYLESLVPAWTDLNTETQVDRLVFNQKWNDYFNARQNLLNAVVDQAGKTAEWPSVTGPGKPQDNATVGAPPGTPVGNSTSDQVISDIEKAKQDMADAKQAISDIDDLANAVNDRIDSLLENLGPTGDAAAAADAAKAFRDAAQLAAQNAELAKQGAEGAYTQISTKAGEAQTFRDQASTFKDEAKGYSATASEQSSLIAGAKEAAEAAATAANTSAGIATAKADAAGQSAQAAQASQVAANTASADAKESADAASTSYTNAESARRQAGQYAQAASGHADTANVKAGEASTSARAASGSAAVATDKASEAATSATLAASYTAGAGNMVVSDFAGGTSGWKLFSNNRSQFDWDVDNADFTIPGEHYQGVLCRQRDGSLTAVIQSDWVAVEPNDWWQASAWLASRECTASIVIDWGDANGYQISASAESERIGRGTYTGWVNLDEWKRIWVKARAPSNARFARLAMIKGPFLTNSGNYLSWAFMLRPMLAPSSSAQTSPSPYAPRGSGADLSGIQTSMARIEDTAEAAATTANAAASKVSTLETNVNGYGSRINTVEQSVTTVRNTANEAFDRVTGARWSKEAIAGNGRAQLTVYAYDNNGRIFSGVDIMGNVTIDGNLTVNGTITSTKMARNAATQVWYTGSSTMRTPINAPSDYTTMLSMNFTKYMGIESVVQFDVQCPMYGSDAVKVEVYLDIWNGGGAPLQNQGYRMEVDGNNETYLPFIYQHLFQNIPAGNYEARFVMRRTSGHDCRTNGKYHMIVREFKR
jgi:chemotaxis protein histidine kinase CheA